MEKWGSGYKRIVGDCADGGYPLPDWVELGAVMRVVFRPHPEVVAADSLADVPINGPHVPINVPENLPGVPINVPISVPINVPINERQRWFLEALNAGQTPKPSDLTARFKVTAKTAKRDIARLRDHGLVEFVGANKNGYYRLLPA
jgi:predicted HTH transcriptional regulator